MMELFCENFWRLKGVSYFRKKLHQMFQIVLNRSLKGPNFKANVKNYSIYPDNSSKHFYLLTNILIFKYSLSLSFDFEKNPVQFHHRSRSIFSYCFYEKSLNFHTETVLSNYVSVQLCQEKNLYQKVYTWKIKVNDVSCVE